MGQVTILVEPLQMVHLKIPNLSHERKVAEPQPGSAENESGSSHSHPRRVVVNNNH